MAADEVTPSGQGTINSSSITAGLVIAVIAIRVSGAIVFGGGLDIDASESGGDERDTPGCNRCLG